MQGRTSKDQLLFDPEIERKVRRNNNKTRKRKLLAKQRSQQEGTSTPVSTKSPKL